MKNILRAACVLWITIASFSVYSVKHDPHDVLKNDDIGDHEAHEKEEQAILAARIAATKNADVYSCQLADFSAQCREYPIPQDALSKLKDLKSSCQSLPKGKFVKAPCPTEQRLARCIQILRNNHDSKSLVYDNHYYRDKKSTWDQATLQRVCQDLEGKLVVN